MKKDIDSSLLVTVCLSMNKKEEFFQYLEERKQLPKTNYHNLCVEEMKKASMLEKKPTLLLHVCCVVCACYPIDFLKDYFDITILFNNSNIYPKEEHDKRLEELKRFIKERYNDEIEVVVPHYDNEEYNKLLIDRADDPEGYKRCFICYENRLDYAFSYANEKHFDYFSTVMTFSRLKDSQKINEIGKELSKKYETKYLFSDFKKNDGQLKSNELCELYNLYKQNYCGCIYSLNESHS